MPGVATMAPAAELSAVVYPPCAICGLPFTAHRPVGTDCGGYYPVRPLGPLGVVAYTHPSRLCRWWWALEAFARARRTVHERRWITRRSSQE